MRTLETVFPGSGVDLLRLFLLAASCAAVAVIGPLISIDGMALPATWWPMGLALGGVIVFGAAAVPAIVLGWLAGALVAGLDPAPAVLAALTGAAAAWAGGWLFRRLDLGPAMDRFRDAGWLVGAVIPLTAILAGLADGIVFAAAGLIPPGDAPLLALSRGVGCLFSAMALVPLVMGLALAQPIATRPARWLEFFAVLGIKAFSAVIINMPSLPYPIQLAMVVSQFPLLAWMAVRFNLLGLGILVAISLIFAMYGTTQGAGPLHEFTSAGQWTTLTVFCVLSTATGLLLYTAMETARRMQADLAQSERRLRDIADSASDFFWETDAEGRLVYVSERFADFVGSQTEALLGRSTFRDETAALTDGDWAEASEAIRLRRPYRNLRLPMTTFTDEHKVLQVSGKPVYDAAGAFSGYRGASSDITEQIESADALFQAQKMETVGQLTGGLAHDFNNLLAVIIGNMELTEDAVRDNPAALSTLRKALNAAERSATLIQRLLAFSRRQALSPRIIDVNTLIVGLGDILDHALGDRITVSRSLEVDPWLIRVDPTQLEAAILNLALNARDAMEGGGSLAIATRNQRLEATGQHSPDPAPPGDYVAVELADTGTGMTPEVLAHIFEPFFTTKDAGRGSGLGLSMAYGFVRQSGGAIDVRSTPGAGTVMTLYLPRHLAGGEADSEPAEPDPAVRGQGERVLLVEDDPGVRELMLQRLERLGYQVEAASHAHEALERLAGTAPVDLLLTDIVLPGGTYGDVLAAQAQAARPGLRVLFMSGYPKKALDRIARLEGAATILRKPFRNHDLAAHLRAVLDSPTS